MAPAIEELARAFSAPSFAVKSCYLLGGKGIIRPHADGVKVTIQGPSARGLRGLNARALFIGESGTSLWFRWPLTANEINRVREAVRIGALPQTKLTYEGKFYV